jgi:hypothetical protein
MSFRRVTLAFLLAAAWITTVLHAGLEANGWIPDHEHRTTHVHEGAHDSHPHEPVVGDAEHDPVLARLVTQDNRLAFEYFLFPSRFLPCLPGFSAGWVRAGGPNGCYSDGVNLRP